MLIITPIFCYLLSWSVNRVAIIANIAQTNTANWINMLKFAIFLLLIENYWLNLRSRTWCRVCCILLILSSSRNKLRSYILCCICSSLILRISDSLKFLFSESTFCFFIFEMISAKLSWFSLWHYYNSLADSSTDKFSLYPLVA